MTIYNFDYSIAIRTLGTAGVKYDRLLTSINNLNIKPKKIIVVLPIGYEKPEYQLGNEIFVYSKKSMIIQRLFALDYVDSEYVLFCDDDVEFSPDFIDKLSIPLIKNDYICSTGPLLDFFPPKGKKYLIASVLGGACVMLRNKEKYYTRILHTGGWSYNRNIDTKSNKIYQAESLAWTCFLIKTDVMREINFEDEMWLDKTGYTAFEDRVMFYKLLINGYKSCVVSNAVYIHNDAKTSSKDLKLVPIYAGIFNHYVFWHRFIYLKSHSSIEKIWSKICIKYYICINKLYWFYTKKSKEEYKIRIKAIKESKEFIKSEEYLNLNDCIIK